jgi:hypothetical protein
MAEYAAKAYEERNVVGLVMRKRGEISNLKHI